VASRNGAEIVQRKAYRLILRTSLALVVMNSLIFIWSYRFLPIQDFPDWVYQGYLLSRFLLGHSLPGYRIISYPVPDSVLTTLLSLLDLAFAPGAAGKIVLSTEAILFVFASVSLLGALGISKDNPIVLMPLIYVFSSFFFYGNIAWLFGFSGYCLYCAYIIRRHETPLRIKAWVVLIASCGLFLTHVAGWYAAGLFTCVIAAAIPLRLGLTRLLLPFVPSGALAIWSFVGQLHTGGLAAHAKWVFWTSHQLAGALVTAFAVFIGFLPWVGSSGGLMHGAAVANLVATLIFVAAIPFGWLLWYRGERRNTPVLIAASVTGAAVVGAGAAYGIFASPGGRLIYPAGWLALCWIAPALERRKVAIAVMAALCTLLALQAIYVDVLVAGVARELVTVYAAMRESKTRSEFCAIYQPLLRTSMPIPHRPGLAAFFPTLMPVVRLPYYLYIERDAAAPVNPVGILRRKHNGDFNDACGVGAIGPGI